jgi:hypothetical protein
VHTNRLGVVMRVLRFVAAAWLAVLYSESFHVQHQQVSRTRLLFAKNTKHERELSKVAARSVVVDSSLRALPILTRRSLRRSGRAVKNSFKVRAHRALVHVLLDPSPMRSPTSALYIPYASCASLYQESCS